MVAIPSSNIFRSSETEILSTTGSGGGRGSRWQEKISVRTSKAGNIPYGFFIIIPYFAVITMLSILEDVLSVLLPVYLKATTPDFPC
jgi:hypothetical protein